MLPMLSKVTFLILLLGISFILKENAYCLFQQILESFVNFGSSVSSDPHPTSSSSASDETPSSVSGNLVSDISVSGNVVSSISDFNFNRSEDISDSSSSSIFENKQVVSSSDSAPDGVSLNQSSKPSTVGYVPVLKKNIGLQEIIRKHPGYVPAPSVSLQPDLPPQKILEPSSPPVPQELPPSNKTVPTSPPASRDALFERHPRHDLSNTDLVSFVTVSEIVHQQITPPHIVNAAEFIAEPTRAHQSPIVQHYIESSYYQKVALNAKSNIEATLAPGSPPHAAADAAAQFVVRTAIEVSQPPS